MNRSGGSLGFIFMITDLGTVLVFRKLESVTTFMSTSGVTKAPFLTFRRQVRCHVEPCDGTPDIEGDLG